MRELIEAIPQSWSDVKLRQWRDICLIKEEDDIEKIIQTISILLECSEDDIRALSLPEYKDLATKITFVNKRIVGDIVTTFELNGKEYGIIPQMDARFISAGEFLDIETWKANPTENIHMIAALIYRPVLLKFDGEYRIEKYEKEGFFKRANLFLDELPITHCYSAVLFFSAYVMKYTEIMTDYLLEEEKQKVKKTKKRQTVTKKHKGVSSTKTGDGII